MEADSESDEDEGTCVAVIEHGSYQMKVGHSGDDYPIIVPTVVADPRKRKPRHVPSKCEMFAGDDAWGKRSWDYFKVDYPIVDNKITNWENMRRIYDHIFYEKLPVSPEDPAFLIIDNAFYPSTHREKMAEMLFEWYYIPYVCFIDQSVAALLAHGMKSGIVIDSGNTTSIVPVYEGVVQRDNVHKVDVSGEDLRLYMEALLVMKMASNILDFTSLFERDLVRSIIEKACYICEDLEEEMKKNDEDLLKMWEHPDGRVMGLKKERFECPEALFNPSLIYKECDGLGEALRKCINGCNDLKMKRELMQNIVLCGGNTMIPGFAKRVYKELGCIPKVEKSQVLIDGFYRNLINDVVYKDINNLTWEYCDESIKDPERWMYAGDDHVQIHDKHKKYGVWIGGSIYAQSEDFIQRRISREEYEEKGADMLKYQL